MRRFWLGFLLLCTVSVILSGCRQAEFENELEDCKHPWTHKAFLNNSKNFHFAIVADRTGGIRPGVFKKAAGKIDLLRPEFVMSVGDMISGYTKDKHKLQSQWGEFKAIVNELDMPFFFVPGNHDISNAEMAVVWKDMFGASYYYFIYKDVLFVCLNTQETPGYVYNSPGRHLSEKQLEWAEKVINEHQDVRWTFVFMHQPLWVYEEDRVISGGRSIKGKRTGFKRVQKALEGRDYTVFAGHFHQYTKYIRNGQEYYTLATTGGGSSLSIKKGEVDHVVWVSMTNDGPVIAQLLLDGIYGENLITEKMRKIQLTKRLFIDGFNAVCNDKQSEITLDFKNIFKNKLDCKIEFEGLGWKFVPSCVSGSAAPGERVKQSVKVARISKDAVLRPECKANFSAGKDIIINSDLSRQIFPPVFKSEATGNAPNIDGKLDDKVWRKITPYRNFKTKPEGKDVSADTKVYLCHDKDNLYIAVECSEPVSGNIFSSVKKHDGPVWKDDSIEIFLDTNNDMKTFFQFVVNPAGVTCDFRNKKRSFELNSPVATSQDGNSWNLEMAIPWKKLDMISPVDGRQIRAAFVRNRVKSKESQQMPPLYGRNHQPKMFGAIVLDNK